LYEKYGATGHHSILLPNAADFDFFSAPCLRSKQLTGIPKPIVGYFGAIASWFDYDLMYRVATSRPQYSFVLIGALGLEEAVIGKEITRFRHLPNVFLLGHKDYSELPSYLAHFDVCIIPFVINQLTRAADPVKLYEYLSQGKPVVSTAIPAPSDRAELLYITKDAEDFVRNLDRAISEPDGRLKQRRISFASQNTWRARAAALDAALRETFPLVSILIVTYNNRDFVDPCLDSIRRNTFYPNYEVLVVDNGSSDGTTELLQSCAQAEPRIRVTRLADNEGFPAASNIATREAHGDYLIFLNIDTMVTEGWIERLVRCHRRDASVGMVVPVTNWAGNEAKINTEYADAVSMEEFAMKIARENMGLSLELVAAPFFCVLVPREVWTKVGELDERFGVGMFEDDDFSLRVRQHNLRIVTAEDCFIHHFGRASFAKLREGDYREIFHRNLQHFEQKWGIPWTPHKYRPGTRPEHLQFHPAEFTAVLRR
jgi:GT2 family glycosyltransferase